MEIRLPVEIRLPAEVELLAAVGLPVERGLPVELVLSLDTEEVWAHRDGAGITPIQTLSIASSRPFRVSGLSKVLQSIFIEFLEIRLSHGDGIECSGPLFHRIHGQIGDVCGCDSERFHRGM